MNKKYKIKKYINAITIYLKNKTPNRFLPRYIYITVIFFIVSTIVLSIVLYRSHWHKIRNQLIYSIEENIIYINEIYSKYNSIVDKHPYDISIKENLICPDIKVRQKATRDLKKALNRKFEKESLCVYETLDNDNSQIHVSIKHDNKWLTFIITEKYYYSSSIVVFWSIMMLIILLYIALSSAFLKRQLSALQKLSKIAKTFNASNNYDIPNIRPAGPQEVKDAVISFNTMKSTILANMQTKNIALAAISHDLKTPITKMNLINDLYKHEYQQDVKKHLRHMTDIINSYIEFSHHVSRNKLAKDRQNIVHILQNLSNSMSSDLFTVIVNAEKCYIAHGKVHDKLFESAISNILYNNIRYADTTKITITNNKTQIFLQIDDNGPGIHKDQVKDILLPFYRGQSNRPSNDSGSSGLGLAIAKEIITQHGGNISVQPNGSLGGASFYIALPIF